MSHLIIGRCLGGASVAAAAGAAAAASRMSPIFATQHNVRGMGGPQWTESKMGIRARVWLSWLGCGRQE